MSDECQRWQQTCQQEEAGQAAGTRSKNPGNLKACYGTRDYICAKGSSSVTPSPSVTPTPSAVTTSSGINAGEIMSGIGAILAPLAQAGVGIYAAQQQAKLAKMQLKYQNQDPLIPTYFPPPQSSGSNTGLVIGLGVVGLIMMGGMFYMMKSGGDSAMVGPAPIGPVATSIAPTISVPRITRVRRVRKRRARRPKK